MTLHINLTPELEARLRERATVAGKNLAEVAREALEEKFISRCGMSAGFCQNGSGW